MQRRGGKGSLLLYTRIKLNRPGIYFIAVVISAGFLLAPFGLPALQYNCAGGEVFPVYTASPFIYRSTSLATSMAHDYYLMGLLADVLLWSMLLLIMRHLTFKFIDRSDNFFKTVYSAMKYLFLVFSILIILLELQVEGQSLKWSANLNNEANDWGMVCSPAFTFDH